MLNQYEREISYAFRILAALSDGRLHTGGEIYAEKKCPQSWGYKIAKKLEGADFITIRRGRYGGYRLKKPLDQITVKDLVKAIAPNAQFIPFLKNSCTLHPEKKTCQTFLELSKMEQELWEVLEKRSVQDIICLQNL